jgi:hypothetical protein
MSPKNPVKSYLALSVRRNGKSILITQLGILVIGIILVASRIIPAMEDIFSDHLLREFVVDLPVKIAIGAAPFILMTRSKTYAKWREANPGISIEKKDFTTATYLEMFIAPFIGVPVLIAVWGAAILADSSIIESVLTTGIFNIGAVFFLFWLMATLLYTLQFTKLLEVNEGAMLLIVCLFGSLWITVGLQSLLLETEIPFTLRALVCALLGLIILFLGRMMTIKLYEKSNF